MNDVFGILGIVEDVVGDSQTDAYNKLKAAGLTPSLQGVYNNEVAASYVVGTEPKAGETLFEGDTVIVYVSRGPQETPIAVPDVEDMSLERAKLLIEQVGLKVGDITYDEKSDKERVIRMFGDSKSFFSWRLWIP